VVDLGDQPLLDVALHRLLPSPGPGRRRYPPASDWDVRVEPDYDGDPGRRAAWVAPQDVHDIVGPELSALSGRVLDIGCGEGRLVAALADGAAWFGVDDSPQQLARCPHRPVARADMRALPFPDGSFAAVVHLWCLYHLDDPRPAIAEARRVLQPGGRYYACTSARANDPELVPEGYPPTTFDGEDAAAIVATVFPDATAEAWDGMFFPLATRDEVRRYCRHNLIPAERAEATALPLWLTKRGVLVRATC
jgi:SAM-dependent methyltransferase